METNLERECSALGGLFQQIINDMKNGTTLWEDLIAKATKLHTCLRATIQAVATFLDAFQKIADAATNARGATKDIGTALTRICLRHKAVEAKMKTFTSAIMDCLVMPLQEKLEEWRKMVLTLDKDHAKEYKKARSELKKKSTDTLRLQKKVRKGKSTELQKMLDTCMHDVNDKYQTLENTEKQAVRTALIEERSRYCLFVACMKPVVDEEVAMMSELLHVQEVMQQLNKYTSDPYALPPASEQVITDIKGSETNWSFQTPPSSPSSIGSRKSSMCSISSLNSSSSGSTKSHSPSHQFYLRTISQPATNPVGTLRLSSVSSQDSGFTSQDTLFLRPPSPPPSELSRQVSNLSDQSSASNSSNSSTPSSPYPSAGPLPNVTATWPNLQQTLQFERAACAILSERPHTISTAYERGHQRPALTSCTFQPLDGGGNGAGNGGVKGNNGDGVQACSGSPCRQVQHHSASQPVSPSPRPEEVEEEEEEDERTHRVVNHMARATLPKQAESRPPVPKRCSSLERPSVPAKTAAAKQKVKAAKGNGGGNGGAGAGRSVPMVPDFNQSAPDMIVPQPVYVNMHELATMAAAKVGHMAVAAGEHDFPPPPPEFVMAGEDGKPEQTEGSASESSLGSSSGYGSQTMAPPEEFQSVTDGIRSNFGTLLRRNSSHSQQKPPPPIRRTSSISISGGVGIPHCGGGSDTASLTSSHSESSLQAEESESSTPRGSLENLPPPPAFLLLSGSQELVSSPGSSTGSISGGKSRVAETVRTLTEINHQPASPSTVRRSHRNSESERKEEPIVSTQHRASLIQALNARFQRQQASPPPTISNSPRHVRRFSEELYRPGLSLSLPKQKPAGPGDPAFLHSLNAKIAQMHHRESSAPNSPKLAKVQGPSPRSSIVGAVANQANQGRLHRSASACSDTAQKVRHWIASRTNAADPAYGRESLMDQIRRGTSLKKTRTMNDRSAPRIH